MATSHRSYSAPTEVVALPAVDGQVVTGSSVLYGVVITDEAAGALQAHLHDGTDNTGDHVAALAAAANGSATAWYGPNGIHCPGGIYLDVVSGTVSGSVFIRA
jgi:hypothetical protein